MTYYERSQDFEMRYSKHYDGGGWGSLVLTAITILGLSYCSYNSQKASAKKSSIEDKVAIERSTKSIEEKVLPIHEKSELKNTPEGPSIK